jgi:flagellar biosynthesis protein FlhB
MLIDMFVSIAILAVDALNLYFFQKALDCTVHLLELRVFLFAFRALLPVCALVVINALLAKVALAPYSGALDALSNKVTALITFKLLEDIFDTAEICNP